MPFWCNAPPRRPLPRRHHHRPSLRRHHLPHGQRTCHHSARHRRRPGRELAARLSLDPRHLRRVEVNYIGFDGQSHRGALIVHEDLAAEVVAIFEQLLQLRFPIEKVRTVDNYPGADDELSMEDNNTSAFNCRDIPGTGRWSPHAFGTASQYDKPFAMGRTATRPPTGTIGIATRHGDIPGLRGAHEVGRADAMTAIKSEELTSSSGTA